MIEAPVQGVVTAFDAALDGMLSADYAALPPLELAGLLTGLEASRRRLAAVEVQVVAALAVQVTPAQFGATSVPDLVGALTRTSRGDARARVQRAQDLAPRHTLAGEALDPIHPLVAAALTGGEIAPEHVDVITRYLGRLPACTSFEVFRAAEAFLVEAAKHEDPTTLRRSGDLLLARLDPDGAEPREEQADRERCFGITERRGRHTVYGAVTDELKAVVQTMLDSLATPRPGVDGQPDPRTAGQRNHDALLEALLRLLGSDTLPATGGTPAKVVVHVDAADLDRYAKGQPGGVARTGHGDVVSLDRFLRLPDQADITTVVLTARPPHSRSRLRRPPRRPPNQRRQGPGGWGAAQGSSLTARSGAPSIRTRLEPGPPHPRLDPRRTDRPEQPLPTLRRPSPSANDRAVGTMRRPTAQTTWPGAGCDYRPANPHCAKTVERGPTVVCRLSITGSGPSRSRAGPSRSRDCSSCTRSLRSRPR